MSNGLLLFRELSVRRGDFLLDRISFSVNRSEITAIIGNSGSGKTVLLETAAGFFRPCSGGVYLNSIPVCDIPVEQRKIGYLYQDYGLFPHMTAGANIGYSLKLKHISDSEIRKQVEFMAQRFGIAHRLNQYPGTLSGGEQQRVALARALMTRVPLLLLDEPFSALDPVTKKELYRLIREIREEFQCAVLFVTHDFEEAIQLADRIGVLIAGKLHGIVPASELFTADWDEDVNRFLGITK